MPHALRDISASCDLWAARSSSSHATRSGTVPALFLLPFPPPVYMRTASCSASSASAAASHLARAAARQAAGRTARARGSAVAHAASTAAAPPPPGRASSCTSADMNSALRSTPRSLNVRSTSRPISMSRRFNAPSRAAVNSCTRETPVFTSGRASAVSASVRRARTSRAGAAPSLVPLSARRAWSWHMASGSMPAAFMEARTRLASAASPAFAASFRA
mmetsp:Transcript_24204/g.82675  ORF Transcript_24204/g.82675 Transcript_24204/m.82675 type:complete len:219 (-) Transcript_24204:108-764(-)